MKRLCVFCGSSPGAKRAYTDAARALGRALTRRNIGLVYGGASVGIMGEIARTVLDEGGDVIGVLPRELMGKEIAFTDLTRLHVVESMHERKALMAELSDGFIALPGGFGTLEELFEVLSVSQLGQHEKPCGLLNVAHYYDSLLQFLDRAVEQLFVQPEHRAMILVDEDPSALLDRFGTYQPPRLDKADWIRRINHARPEV
jgi:uncharacterized protein (TIGR00730 family)